MSTLYTTPPSETQTTRETYAWRFDYSARVGVGQSLSGASSVLTDLATNQPIALTDAPTISGAYVDQVVRGSALVGGHRYRLQVAVQIGSGSTNVHAPALLLEVPF